MLKNNGIAEGMRGKGGLLEEPNAEGRSLGQGSFTLPSSPSPNPELCATSHGWPSGSMKTPAFSIHERNSASGHKRSNSPAAQRASGVV